MGIPSYYRTLLLKIPHSIQRSAPQGTGTLVVDMNCMVYHVLKEPSMTQRTYPGEEGRLAWEKALQREVCTYLTHIWRSSGSPLKVYIALDGVVPYAKIKQQRFRRFKSAAARKSDTWDTNAITPGTAFMASLAYELRQTGSKYGWILSDTDEPGEGEHKVLRWLLDPGNAPSAGPIVIYGLDADLILLGLLAGERLGNAHPIFLLRESQVFGKLVRHSESAQAELGFFNLIELKQTLPGPGESWTTQQLYDYIFGMSFCGNDFLPTGLSVRIRDDGHSLLLGALHDLWGSGNSLVKMDPVSLHAKPCSTGLVWISKWFLRQEERLVLGMIRRKRSARHGEVEEDNLPLIEQAESPLVQIVDGHTVLRRDWKETYSRLALGDSHVEHRKACVNQFWTGWCWILDYYQGLPVDLDWVYANGYPPTWSDLVAFFPLTDKPIEWECNKEPLTPQQQLALVLPLSSWGLLMKTKYRLLPTRLSHFWPQDFHLETFGKRFGWECEPMIPLFTPARLRYELLGMNPV